MQCNRVLVNTHYLRDQVRTFLDREHLVGWVEESFEEELLGTAGTIRANAEALGNDVTLIAHADNWCCCDFKAFQNFHEHHRPSGTVMTMMTFDTNTPQSCGIVETDDRGVATAFHEKVDNPPSNLANAAVYIVEPTVIRWIQQQEQISDFSTQVIERFLGKIATWHNAEVNIDIGTIEKLIEANRSTQRRGPDIERDEWWRVFENHNIHEQLRAHNKRENT